MKKHFAKNNVVQLPRCIVVADCERGLGVRARPCHPEVRAYAQASASTGSHGVAVGDSSVQPSGFAVVRRLGRACPCLDPPGGWPCS